MRAARLVLGALGVVAGLFGAWRLLGRVQGSDLLDVVVWMAGVVVVHDAVLAPLTVLLTVALRRVVPAAWRSRVTVALLVLVTVTLTAVPVLGRFGARSDNPTLLDRDYTAGWWVLAGVVLAVTLLVGPVSRRLRRRPAEEVSPPAE